MAYLPHKRLNVTDKDYSLKSSKRRLPFTHDQLVKLTKEARVKYKDIASVSSVERGSCYETFDGMRFRGALDAVDYTIDMRYHWVLEQLGYPGLPNPQGCSTLVEKVKTAVRTELDKRG